MYSKQSYKSNNDMISRTSHLNVFSKGQILSNANSINDHCNRRYQMNDLGKQIDAPKNINKLDYSDDNNSVTASSESSSSYENRKPQNDSNRKKKSGDKRRRSYNNMTYDVEMSCSNAKKFSMEVEKAAVDVESAYGSSLQEVLDSCFSKKYSFRIIRPHKFKYFKESGARYLYSVQKWKNDYIREFQLLKTKLNTCKAQLNDYDLNEWHRHTRSTNPADLVMKRLRVDMKVEFLTQAWCKFYELVSEFKLIPQDAKNSKELYTIHLCEAPGAFIASLNHYLTLKWPNIDWHWKANSLNPYYEGNALSQMINDDRFMLQTISCWDFGPDMTGDITHPDYPNHLRKKCGAHKPHLVTADGSFDCQDKPEEQESSVSWLHLKETLTALRTLKKGGYFVIKMFTFFECDTICLLYLLASVFESVNVMKPATSKEGNSEVYVVCREFKGDEYVEPYMNDLMAITPEIHNEYAMFPYEHISREFLTQALECAKLFANFQMNVINRNIKLFTFRNDEEMIRKPCSYVQEKLWDMFVKNYELKPIDRSRNIVPMSKTRLEIRKSSVNVMEKREHKQGSHSDQIKRRTMDEKEIIDRISQEWSYFNDRSRKGYIPMPEVFIDIEHFKIEVGKPILRVVSSQFCHGSYIRMRNELMDVVSIDQFNIFVFDPNSSINVDDKDNISIDFRPVFMKKNNYNEAQLESFRMIFEKLSDLKNSNDLIFIGYPLLTQFNVNVLCLLRQIFEQIEFFGPNTLFLYNLNLRERNKWLSKMDEICRIYKEKLTAVISFLPLNVITGVQNPVYSWIVEVNNIRVMDELGQVITFKKQ